MKTGPPADAPVLQPGRPGEPVRTLPPDAKVPGTAFNRADVSFVTMMIPHHAQALHMCELARRRAEDRRVSALARRIDAAQGPEILAMSAWLAERGLPVPSAQGHSRGAPTQGGHADHAGHGVHGQGGAPSTGVRMPGMLSDAQLRKLARARGSRFDRLFLTGMIRHHRGAVVMARRVSAAGSDLRVAEIASDVAAEQSAEIARMREVLAGL